MSSQPRMDDQLHWHPEGPMAQGCVHLLHCSKKQSFSVVSLTQKTPQPHQTDVLLSSMESSQAAQTELRNMLLSTLL